MNTDTAIKRMAKQTDSCIADQRYKQCLLIKNFRQWKRKL